MKPLPYTLDDQKVQANFDALATQGVNGADLVNGSVSTAKLADSLVSTAKLADSSVTSAKIADSAVTSAKIADGTITSTDLATSVVNGYLKLATAADKKIAFGRHGMVTGMGGSGNVGGRTTYTLDSSTGYAPGFTPTFVLVSADGLTGTGTDKNNEQPISVSVLTFSSTSVDVVLAFVDNTTFASVGTYLNWVALG